MVNKVLINSTRIATTAYVQTELTDLIGSAPAALDTLNELAAAINDDSAFSSTVTTSLGNRLRVDTASQGLSSTEQSNARTNLGLGSAATSNTSAFLGATAKAADSDKLDNLNSTQFLRSDASDSFSGKLTGTNANENLEVGGIRGTTKGSQTGDYIHLYERVHIGGPSGWGHSTHGAPSNGLGVWGAIDLGMGGSGALQVDGTTVLTNARVLQNVTAAAGIITSGTFADARIPSLAASKITSGTFADARIASASNWNTAYTDRNKWDGGSTGLTASTGRTSLGLGSAATQNTSAFATAAQGTKADNAMPDDFLNTAKITFTVGGDADTYYPVSIQGGGQYAFQMYSISRQYNATAPDTWNTSTHKGGLTLTWQYSGDSFWGGNDHDIRIVKFDETYSQMVMGIAGSVGGGGTNAGVVVWLRGGTASYNFHGPRGSDGDVNVHLTSVTASDGTVFSSRSYNASTRDGEILPKYPIRDSSLLYDNNNRVARLESPAFTGTPTAPTTSSAENSTKIATTAYVKSQGYITSASGGNAATLDGIDSTSFLRSDAADTASGVISFTGGHGAINITNSSILSSATSNWTGDPGGAGKIQYHSNRWYIVSDSSSNRIVQFRRNSSDVSYIDNAGGFHGNVTGALTGNASTATTLATARTIAGTSFNGSANINISYNNLTDKPTIPTNNNQLTNGAGYLTTSSASSTYLPFTGGTLTGNLQVNGYIRGAGQQLVLNAGESYSVATGQTSEYIYLNAEQGIEINSATDNWTSGWTARKTAYLKGAYGWGNHASAGYITGNQTITLSGDATGSGTTSISVSLATDSVTSSEIAANAVGASELNVSGNGTTAQFLRSDGDGTFTWATPTDTNTVYTHPTHAGDDINIDTGALTGATVISDLDFNITTNSLGHVTDANGTVATRTLTAANLGISAPNAPTSLSASIVGETIDLTFNASSTSNIDAYLVYSSVDGSDYGLIQVIPPDDFSATMSVIDSAFTVTGTQAYRVYAMKYGILSSAGTASVSYTVSSAEPTDMSVVNLNNAYFVQWNPPSANERFVSAYNVYKHEAAASGSLSRSSASLVYSGLNTNFMYQISGNNNSNYHQFWVETTIA
jgi:hypothetical protein